MVARNTSTFSSHTGSHSAMMSIARARCDISHPPRILDAKGDQPRARKRGADASGALQESRRASAIGQATHGDRELPKPRLGHRHQCRPDHMTTWPRTSSRRGEMRNIGVATRASERWILPFITDFLPLVTKSSAATLSEL